MLSITETRMHTLSEIPEGRPFVSVDFEVYGQVQGVYFTKYCKEMCEKLGLCGWVKNSKRQSIVGKIQGPRHKVDEMISWMSKTGSPGSKISRCDLSNWEYLARQDFRGFSVRY